MAHLIAFAFHNPKKIPDFTKSRSSKSTQQADPGLAKEQLRASLIRLHFSSQGAS